MKRGIRGYSLLEVVVALAVLGVFLFALIALESDMRAWERRLPVNFMKHPQIIAVLSRLRRDVLDAHGPQPYRNSFQGFTMSDKVLILESVQPAGDVQTIVWDFSRPGEVLRRSYKVGVPTDWRARGIPPGFSDQLMIDAVEDVGRAYGVRITAKDPNGKITIDQILQPRAHD